MVECASALVVDRVQRGDQSQNLISQLLVEDGIDDLFGLQGVLDLLERVAVGVACELCGPPRGQRNPDS